MKISKKISVITLAALFSLLFAMTAFGATGKVTGLKQEKASTNTVSIAWDNYLGTNVKYIIVLLVRTQFMLFLIQFR